MKHILVIGRHEQIMQTVLKLINQQEGYHAVGCLLDEQAIAILQSQNIDLVLIGGGVEIESEQAIRKYVELNKPTCKVIQHFGGGSGLLFNELKQALGS
ncbi:MAG: hypothetical protein ACOVP1_02675 [Bacteroidia bacterium]